MYHNGPMLPYQVASWSSVQCVDIIGLIVGMVVALPFTMNDMLSIIKHATQANERVTRIGAYNVRVPVNGTYTNAWSYQFERTIMAASKALASRGNNRANNEELALECASKLHATETVCIAWYDASV